ncbi:MAG: hypothetical protein ABSG91_17645 [Syntrophobacteraceae bacterium]|jgi:hypothetical protein
MSDGNKDRLLGECHDNFTRMIESELAEDFLEVLLDLMKAVYSLPLGYEKNIENFTGRYQFLDRTRDITIGVDFHDKEMHVVEGVIDDPHIKITFQDGRALMKFLLEPKQDVLAAMLHHEVTPDGNLNYLYRFGFMARQLQKFSPPL